MSHFGVYMPDDTPITNLLYHSSKLSEDLKAAAQAATSNAQGQSSGRQRLKPTTHRGPGPRKYKRK